MVISVQDNLKDIILNLESLGYDVHKISEGKISDIYIYKEKDIGLNSLSNHIKTNSNGAFIINADNKSLEDILYCINNRVYSPLF